MSLNDPPTSTTQDEIHRLSSSLETTLQQKIVELQASEDMRLHLSHQVNSLKNQLAHYHKTDMMVGRSRRMQEIREMIHQVSGADATILITGETGTGKELVANLIRATSARNDKPFVKINCQASNDAILEADLFGCEQEAFADAITSKIGKFEVADGGTIFLDEIGAISPRIQANLLRVLQNGEILRVGGTEPVKVDVRVIAATKVDLAQAVKEKKIRLDLYYRLNIINIQIPPLRERKEDLVELVSHFVDHYREAFKKEIDVVPLSILNRLLAHDWPGNVRELENLIQRAVRLAKGKTITENDLLFDPPPREEQQQNDCSNIDEKLGVLPLKAIVAEFEAAILHRALKKYSGNVSIAATQLRIGKTALYDKMKQHGLSAKHIQKSD